MCMIMWKIFQDLLSWAVILNMSYYIGKDTEWFEHIVIFYAMGLGTCSKNLICHPPTDSDTDYKSTKDTDY